jgi:ankyrin repeat protein
MLKHYFRYISFLLVGIHISCAVAGSYEDFFVAVANDDEVTVNALLTRGFDPNTVGPQGQMPLYAALQKGSSKVAEALWHHPALQVDVANVNGETPLMMAALRGNLAWCQRLVKRGAAINRDGWSPVHYAASGPDPKVVAWLLEQGALAEAKSPNGSTPLMMAAGYGSEASVDVLLAKGADAAARNDLGMTAADFASRAGRERLAQRLTPPKR